MLSRNFAALSAMALAAACNSTPQASSTREPEALPRTPAEPTVSTQAAAPAAELTRIADPSTVCMINDQFMGVAQIPVQVEGKTYYGCCQACEAKLKTNVQARLGTDPVTQKAVDKATAVLAKDAKGKVLYFENEESMQAYAARM